jgi:UDP-glucose 4-epimerase
VILAGVVRTLDILGSHRRVSGLLSERPEIEYESVREADAEHTHASVEGTGELMRYEPSRTTTESVGEFIEWC